MTAHIELQSAELAATTESLAAAIVAQHSARFAGFPAQATPCNDHSPEALRSSPIYRAALQACSALGFIASDAQCLAQAWERQSQRLGRCDPTHWPDDPRDFDLRAMAHFPSCPSRLGLYAVLPDAQWVARMAAAGVPTVQLRFKSQDHHAITRQVQAAVQAVRSTKALLFINDHWREAIAAGAYGVHLGQEDLDALSAQELATLRASGLRLGVSTHGYAEMLRADAVGPSYVALGAVFATTLKKMVTAPQGIARLAAYAHLLQGYPLVAIGGIGVEQFPHIAATGVGSIAVVRALVQAPDPEQAAQQLMQQLPT